MNIEDFFINEYKNIKAERDDLRKELDSIKADNRQYGVFDLGEGIAMVRVDLTGSYNFKDESLSIVKLGSERIQELIDKPQDELIRWAKGFRVGSYYGKVLEVKRERYRYTIKTVDMDGETLYAFDPSKGYDLVEIGKPEHKTDEWEPEDNLDRILDIAYDKIVDGLRSALIKAQEVEAEKAAQEEAESEDHE